MTANHYLTTGRFNLLSDEKQEQIVLTTEYGTISATFPLDESGYDDSLLPSEVAVLIRERLKAYLIYSRREEVLKIVEQVLQNAPTVDSAWLLRQADLQEFRSKELLKHAKRLRDRAADLQADATDTAGEAQSS